ncbi:DUF4249 domain-containing protein [bacterium]|nr:DUF4249 domain-containing protein [bacterium]
MTKRSIIIFLTFAALWLTAGCDNSGKEELISELVLQGYLYVNKPMSVRLIRTAPINQFYDEAGVGISGAAVTIWEISGPDSTAFTLTEDTTALSGTYVVADPEADDTVRSGRHYAIRVETNGRTITAETQVAAPPIRLDSCRIAGRLLADFRNPDVMDTLWYNDPDHPYEVYWTGHPDRYGTTIFIENIESDWYADWRELSGHTAYTYSSIFIWTMLTNNSFEVPWITVGFEGRHRVRVISSDEPCFEYYQTVFPGYAEMSPETNVRGALGVFCAIDVDTAYFYLNDPDN